MSIRDRIRELRRIPAAQLRPNPRNWRTHSPAQQDTLRAVLAEIGYADALLARELADGSVELIDGHLRAETTPNAIVPVLVLDLDDAEANKLLATFDPLTNMAGIDEGRLCDLVADIDTDNPALRAMLDDLLTDAAGPPEPDNADAEHRAGIDIPDLYQVVAQCADEADQQALYERLTAEGYRCRLLSL